MIKAILLDIEGTLSSISYVKDVMFPYFEENLRNFLKKYKNDENVKKFLKEIQDIVGKEMSLDEIVSTLEKWVEKDKKLTPLKELQGFIWKDGFESKKLQGHIYEDAMKKLKEWKDKGYNLYVYSSGSINAQKLYFSYSKYGNILNFFSGYFDTKIGNKKEKDSYLKIAKKLNLKVEEILFLTDNPDEVKAAAEAGMKVIRIVRPEDAKPIKDFPYLQVSNFNEINIDKLYCCFAE